MSAMTKKEWMEYLEKTWDAAQREAWSEPQFECPRCGHCCKAEWVSLTGEEVIAAGDGVLMNEQAALLRECRMALDHLLRDKPMLAAKVCGTTTLGNLRAMLHEYRPQGVFGGMK